MKGRTLAVLGLFIVIGLASVLWRLSHLPDPVQIVMPEVDPEPLTPVATGAVLISGPWLSGGIPRKVVTRKGELDPEETDTQHTARHKAAFDAMIAAFPKDP